MQANSSSVTSDPPTQQQPAAAAATTVAPPPPQWVAMQYPPAAMVMQHHMIPPPHYPAHYLPYHPHLQQQQQHHPSPTQQQGSAGENRTIWVGDLHNWMDEDYLRNCFASTGEVASIKVIRNKQNGFSEGYGFVEFFTHAAAEKVLQSYACIPMPNANQPFRLNWATFSMGDKRSNNGSDLSIFVGDLASDVTDTLLHETFASKYPSVKAAKVVIDANTGRSKGYGFVRFGDDSERSQAMTEMNGTYCSSRAMRIGAATPRKSSGYQQQYSSEGGYVSNGESDGDSTNTTIFVGGLDANVSDEDLRQPFAQYGEIVSVKIPVGKGCGFVQFANSFEQSMATSGLVHTMGDNYMMDMDMQCQLMIQECMLLQHMVLRTPYMAPTNNELMRSLEGAQRKPIDFPKRGSNQHGSKVTKIPSPYCSERLNMVKQLNRTKKMEIQAWRSIEDNAMFGEASRDSK